MSVRRRWKLPDTEAREKAARLAARTGWPRAFASVLVRHGLSTDAEARSFLEPDGSSLHDPLLLPDMEPALERLAAALDARERVFVCGDYDVDGITSVVLVKRCLEAAGIPVGYYVPNRLLEGYGLSQGGMQAARDYDSKLIVTVDSGVTGHEEVRLAREHGIDVIVTDHHEPQDSLPDAVAVVDPKRKDSRYPYKDLAGVGVAYKVMAALARESRDIAYLMEDCLELVAVGTVADIVPLTSENRVLTTFGLERLRTTRNPGLRALMDVAGVASDSATAAHVGFALGPRLNAAGRLGDARIGVELLTTRDEAVAVDIARRLEGENRRRRDLEGAVLGGAVRMIEECVDLETCRSIVLWSSEWHPGVIGIVASRIAKQYNRPTVLLSVADATCRGSGRSIPGFDLHAALVECRHCLTSFGGHRHAAGVSLSRDRLLEFRECVERVASALLSPADLVPVIEIDDLISLSECDNHLVAWMKKLRPFGAGNPEPVFGTRGVELVAARVVGNGHLRLTIAHGDRVMDAIGFGMADVLPDLGWSADGARVAVRGRHGVTVDLAYVLEENVWRGTLELQLRIKDIQPAEH